MNTISSLFDLLVIVGEHHATLFRGEAASPARYLARVPLSERVKPEVLVGVVERLARSGDYGRILLIRAVKAKVELALEVSVPVLALPAPAVLETALKMHRSGLSPGVVPQATPGGPVPQAANALPL